MKKCSQRGMNTENVDGVMQKLKNMIRFSTKLIKTLQRTQYINRRQTNTHVDLGIVVSNIPISSFLLSSVSC